MLLYILQKNISRQREVNGWAEKWMDELAQEADVWLPWYGHLASGGGIAEWSVGPQRLSNNPFDFQSS